MATLTGTTIQSTYDSLLKVTDNDAITATLKRITDGLGNNTPLYLSSSAVEIASGLNVIGSLTASNVSGSNTGDETKASIETKLGAASASNSGYLTSSDWSTFNNKIAGTGTLNTVAKFSSTGSIADSNITDTGSLITLGSNTNISSGSLGLGNTALTGYSIRASRQLTGGTQAYGITNDGNVQPDVTVTARGFYSLLGISAGTGLGALIHYHAQQGTISGTVTNQFGFAVNSGTIGGTNNYAFYGDLPSGTGRWNLYMNGTANNHLAGSLGIGSITLAGHNLRVEKNVTGATVSYGIFNAGTVQSDVTGSANYYISVPATQATTFTLPILRHYQTDQGTFGAGSTVTTQVGFNANSTLIGAGTNYGFRGQIPAGTNRWNLFMDGTANNHLAGRLAIGTTGVGSNNVIVGGNMTGAIASSGILSQPTVQSDVTSIASYFRTTSQTQAASFTTGDLMHYWATQGTFGAGSTVTNQYGFHVESNLIGATNNFAFRGNIPAGTGRWNLFMGGTADNHLAGALGIGTTALTGYNVRISRNLTGSVDPISILNQPVVQSDGTGSAVYYRTTAATAAASFTVGAITHYQASQGTIGAGSSVTNQLGFYATSSMVGGTNNYGFYGEIPAGTNRWNLFMTGTANNHMAGSLGIGSTALTEYSLRLSKTITGATISYGVQSQGVIQSDVTSIGVYYSTLGGTQATTFTLDNLMHFRAAQGTFGAGSTVTNQYGVRIDNNLIGATNNFGLWSNIPSGTGRWNLYMNGTANNYLAGSLGLGTTSLNTPSGYTTITSDGTNGSFNEYRQSAGNVLRVGTESAGAFVSTPASVVLRLMTANTERVRITSAGNTLVGTSTDNGTGALLQVAGGITYTNIFNRRANNYTLVLTDQNDIVEMNIDVTANTVTVPTNASVAFPIGTEIMIMRYGSGVTEIVPASGVTIRSKASYRKIADQYTGATLVKVGTDEWYLVGNLTA